MPAGRPPSVTLSREELLPLLHAHLENALDNDNSVLTQKQLASRVVEQLLQEGRGLQENVQANAAVSYLKKFIADSTESCISTTSGRYAYCFLRHDAEKFHCLAKIQRPDTQSAAFRFVDDCEKGLAEQYISVHFGLWLALQGYEVVLEQNRKQVGQLTNPDVAAWTSSDFDFLVLLDAKDTDVNWAYEITRCCGYKRFANLSYIGYALDMTKVREIESYFGPWTCWDQTLNMCELSQASGVGLVFLEYERQPREAMLEWHRVLERDLTKGVDARKLATSKLVGTQAWINSFRVHKLVDAERDSPAPSVIRRYLDERGWLSDG